MRCERQAGRPSGLRTRMRARLQGEDRQILALAVPAFGALVAEPLFLLADSPIVGRLGTVPLAGLGVAGAAARHRARAVRVPGLRDHRRGRPQRRRRATCGPALAAGVDGMWLAAPARRRCWRWSRCRPHRRWSPRSTSGRDVARQAVTYLRWSLPGVPAMLVVLAATGVLRGLQDTRTPLLVAATGAAVNAVLNVLLVYGAGLGIAGSGHRHLADPDRDGGRASAWWCCAAPAARGADRGRTPAGCAPRSRRHPAAGPHRRAARDAAGRHRRGRPDR